MTLTPGPPSPATWSELNSARPGGSFNGAKPTAGEIEARRNHAKRRETFMANLALHKRSYLKAKEKAGKAGARRRRAGRQAERQQQLAQEQRRREQRLYEAEGGEGEVDGVLGVARADALAAGGGGRRGRVGSLGLGEAGAGQTVGESGDAEDRERILLVRRPSKLGAIAADDHSGGSVESIESDETGKSVVTAVEKREQEFEYLCLLDIETTCDDYAR